MLARVECLLNKKKEFIKQTKAIQRAELKIFLGTNKQMEFRSLSSRVNRYNSVQLKFYFDT